MTTFGKKCIDLLTPSAGSGCIYGQNICYHIAACVILFNLIWNMTIIILKSLILASTPPVRQPRGSDPGLKLKSCLICFIRIYCTAVYMQSVGKNIDYWLSYCNIIYLTFVLAIGVRGWGKMFVTVMLIYRHWAIMVYSEKLSDIIFGKRKVHYPQKADMLLH